MTTASVETAKTRVPERTLLDRLLAAFPIIALSLCVLIFYAVEAWLRKTPWVFSDELEWSQISRSIATTGHSARRGEPVFFKSAYAFVIAPFWWIHSTATAYSAIKYANVVVMTLAAVPTYLLARMLVTRRSAVIVALLSVTVPAMAYVTTIIPEILAYPYYALCSWLAVRAFKTGRTLDIVLAGGFAVAGLLVREPQFATISAAFVIGGAGLWVTGPRGRAVRSNWTKSDTLGAVVLLVGALFLFNRVVLQHVFEWQYSTEHLKPRMEDLGLRAGLSFMIGMGILPVIGGFASLRLRERRGDPAYRAFVAWAAPTILCVSLYTAIKAAYLSTIFATLWEERNLIYLSPLMLIGTALVFESKQIDWRLVGAAAAFVGVIVWVKQFQLGYPYFEAPGFAIPAVIHRHLGWSVTDMRWALMGMLAVSLVLLALRRRRAIATAVVVLAFAWMLTAEITMTVGMDNFANAFVSNLPGQLNWVDEYSHDGAVTYLGQEIRDPNGVWLTEFWNRSIKHVDSTDTTAPGPGPFGRANILTPDGLLAGFEGYPYVLADTGIVLDAKIVHREGKMTLYRHHGPWHLLDAVQQQYADGWCPASCGFTYYKAQQQGTLVITLSRTAYNGSAPPGQVDIYVGTVRINDNNEPELRHIDRHLRRIIRNGTQETVTIPVAQTPVRVEVSIDPTIPPVGSDQRTLGAQVGFSFVPR